MCCSVSLTEQQSLVIDRVAKRSIFHSVALMLAVSSGRQDAQGTISLVARVLANGLINTSVYIYG